MNLESYIKNELEGFDAGFDSNAWNKISNQVAENNANASSLKDKLQNYDAGSSSSAWSNISNQVAKNNASYRRKQILKGAASVAAFVALTIVAIIGYNSNKPTEIENNLPVVQESQASSEQSANHAENPNTSVNNSEINATDIIESAISPQNEIESNGSATQIQSTSDYVAESNPEIPHNVKPSARIASIHLEKEVFCPGEEINIDVVSSNNDNLGLIVNGTSFSSEINNASIQLLSPGQHQIQLVDKETKEILEKRDIVVSEKPKAEFEFDNNHGAINTTRFEATDKNLASLNWYVGAEKIGVKPIVEHEFSNKGKYQVKLVACNANGCKDSSLQLVRIMKAYNLMAAQVFNPAKGTWLPLGLKKEGQQFELTVISEKGETVFVSTSNTKEWDGQYENSDDKAQSGEEYFWIAKVKDSKGKVQEYGGSFIVASNL